MRKPDIEYQNAADRPSGALKASIDKWAADVAQAVKFKPGASIQNVINGLGGRLHYGDAPDSPDGGTIYVHGEWDFDILLPEWTSPRRDRFTMAHELGHFCLHAKFGEVPLVACRTGTGRSEWEANWFAAGFLMPKKSFVSNVAQGLSTVALASLYEVSEAAIEIRKKSLGLKHEPVEH